MSGALADTHALLWWLANDGRLSSPVRRLIADGAVTVYFSPASIWEVEIKASAGRLEVPQDLLEQTRADGFVELGISAEHARLAGRLPLLHRDPFDRMLVAQAQAETLPILTRDQRIAAYDVDVIW